MLLTVSDWSPRLRTSSIRNKEQAGKHLTQIAPPNSKAVIFYFWMFGVFFVLGITNQVVLPTYDALVAQDPVALSDAVRTDMWMLGTLALVAILMACFIVPGWLRQRAVRRSYSRETSDLIYIGRFNKPLRQVLRQNSGLLRGPEPRGVAFGFSATSDGLQFWGGILRPRLFMVIPWSAASEFLPSYIDVSGRVMSTVSFESNLGNGDQVHLSFALGSSRFLGSFPRTQNEIELVVKGLNGLRTACM
jgi:hypothetical protein